MSFTAGQVVFHLETMSRAIVFKSSMNDKNECIYNIRSFGPDGTKEEDFYNVSENNLTSILPKFKINDKVQLKLYFITSVTPTIYHVMSCVWDNSYGSYKYKIENPNLERHVHENEIEYATEPEKEYATEPEKKSVKKPKFSSGQTVFNFKDMLIGVIIIFWECKRVSGKDEYFYHVKVAKPNGKEEILYVREDNLTSILPKFTLNDKVQFKANYTNSAPIRYSIISYGWNGPCGSYVYNIENLNLEQRVVREHEIEHYATEPVKVSPVCSCDKTCDNNAQKVLDDKATSEVKNNSDDNIKVGDIVFDKDTNSFCKVVSTRTLLTLSNLSSNPNLDFDLDNDDSVPKEYELNADHVEKVTNIDVKYRLKELDVKINQTKKQVNNLLQEKQELESFITNVPRVVQDLNVSSSEKPTNNAIKVHGLNTSVDNLMNEVNLGREIIITTHSLSNYILSPQASSSSDLDKFYENYKIISPDDDKLNYCIYINKSVFSQRSLWDIAYSVRRNSQIILVEGEGFVDCVRGRQMDGKKISSNVIEIEIEMEKLRANYEIITMKKGCACVCIKK